MRTANLGLRVALPWAVSVGLAVSGFAASAHAADSYLIQELVGLINAEDVNNAGQVIGNSSTRAYLWNQGAVTELGTLGGARSFARAINNLGQIVGYSDITEIDPSSGYQLDRPFLWLPAPAYGLPAGMHNLGTLGGSYHSYANDINDVGQVVGQSRPTGSAYAHAFRWQNGVMTDLGTLATTSEALGINNLGQAVGWSYDAAVIRRAVLFSGGSITDLGDLGGFAWSSTPSSVAQSINAAGAIVGDSYAAPRPGDNQSHVFRWTNGAMSDLNALSGSLRRGTVRTINAAGLVLGATEVQGPVLWNNGRMIVLRPRLAVAGWQPTYVKALNDRGQIVVWAKNSTGQVASLLLTPDCNENGLADHVETQGGTTADLNGNTIPDSCERDCNGNAVPDDLDVAQGYSQDANANGSPDECHEFDDCNANGSADYLDLATGAGEDRNANSILDACEPHGAHHVDAAAAGRPVQNGSESDPFATIQQAIDQSLSGDEIILAEGVYEGLGNREIRTGGRAITIRSTEPSDPAVVANTVIDPEQAAGAFVFDQGETPNTILDGITLRNGKAFLDALNTRGGGIYAHNSSPTIRRCVFTGNRAGTGGGIALEYSESAISDCLLQSNDNNVPCYECKGAGISIDRFSSVTIDGCTLSGNVGSGITATNSSFLSLTNSTITGHDAFRGGGLSTEGGGAAALNQCTITYNSASDGGGVFGSVSMTDCFIAYNTVDDDGGGIYTLGAPTLTNCEFVGNHAAGSGGGVHGDATMNGCTIEGNFAGYTGGGAHLPGNARLERCVLRDNTAQYRGGGVATYNSIGLLELVNCTLSGNAALYTTGSGGGLSSEWNTGVVDLTGCLFHANHAPTGGGVATFETKTLRMMNCTFTENAATRPGPRGGAAIHAWAQTPVTQTLTNSIAWNNSTADGAQIHLLSSSMTIEFSDVEDGQYGVSLENGIMTPSLTWGAGNLDLDPLFVDPPAENFHLAASSPCIDAGDPASAPEPQDTDFDGDPRLIGGYVDIGADEFRLPGDMDADGDVDLADYIVISWCITGPAAGPPDPDCQVLDADDDSDVDLADLAGFQAAFGAL